MFNLVGVLPFDAFEAHVPVKAYFAKPGGHKWFLDLGTCSVSCVCLAVAMMDWLLLRAGRPAVNLLGQQVCALQWMHIKALVQPGTVCKLPLVCMLEADKQLLLSN